ncbi:MAG TPA: glycosyltransferase 87 family protein, partial [Ktedonobacterales bacterium]|nr:glycosyltransferase 87 family protein [Ktedonobacterales bacterium]
VLIPSPRLALLISGTLLQTAAFTAWMATPDGPSGALAAWAGAAFLAAMALLVVACALPANARLARVWRARRYRLAMAPLVVALALAVLWTGALAGDTLLHAPLDPGIYASDAASFTHFNAELVLRGVNPYTADDRFWLAVARFPKSAATPLRRGSYARLTWASPDSRVRRDLAEQTADPATRHGEFAPASLHSYPALAFLAFVPVVWMSAGSTLPMSLVILLALSWLIGRRLAPGERALGWALLAANSVAVLLTLRGSFEALAVLLALLAWQALDRPRWSPVLLGLACAVKQTVWPLAPLYLLLVLRRDGWRAALARSGIALAAFLAPNAPFIVAGPAAWARSLALPLTLPTFPDGIGLMAFARAGLLPLWPASVYTALQLAALASIALWLARARRAPRPELALLLGMLPLALGWRSLTSYFIWLPAVALYAALPLLRADRAGSARADATAPQSGVVVE